jgi:hypothetical protein
MNVVTPPPTWRTPMDALFVLLAALGALVAIDLSSIDWSPKR